MFRSLNIAATGMSAQQTQLDGIAHNIANANTVGFKRQRTDFQDLLYQTVRAPGAPTGPTTMSPTGLQLGTGVRVVGTSRTFEQGTLYNTQGRPTVGPYAPGGEAYVAPAQPGAGRGGRGAAQ